MYVCVCVWTPCSLHEILRGEDGDVRGTGIGCRCVMILGRARGLWVMAVWPTHSLLPCSSVSPHLPQPPLCLTEQMTFMPEIVSYPPPPRLSVWKGGILPQCATLSTQKKLLRCWLLLTWLDWFHRILQLNDCWCPHVRYNGPLSFHANWSAKARAKWPEETKKKKKKKMSTYFCPLHTSLRKTYIFG